MKTAFIVTQILLLISCGQNLNLDIEPDNTNDDTAAHDRSESSKSIKKTSEEDFCKIKYFNGKIYYLTDSTFNVNGISLLDTFSLKRFIKKVGKPDSLYISGKDIIEEFGYNDYYLQYSKSFLFSSHGYLLNAEIYRKGISFNKIQIGDSVEQILKYLNISKPREDTVKILNKNDDILIIYFSKEKIIRIDFERPL